MLRLAIYTFSRNYTQELATELIPLGMDPIETDSIAELGEWIRNDRSISLVLTESNDESFLKSIMTENPNLHIFLIIHPGLKPAELIKLSKLGIRSIIDYQENVSILCEEVGKNVIQQNIRTKDKRLHVRVQPKAYEKLTASIYLKQKNRFIYTNIVDISAGGIAVLFPEDPDLILVQPGKLYDPLILSIKGYDIKTVSTMVSRRETLGAFKFDNIEAKEMRVIANYLHSRLTENAGNFMKNISE